MTQSPNKLYAKILSEFGFGYPLWIPGPSQNAPPTYMARGVSIGDVGIKKSDGSLDFLFDASLPETDSINLRGVPGQFDPLHIEPDDIHMDPDFFPPWTYIGEKCVKDVDIKLEVSAGHPSGMACTGGSLDFKWSSRTGAILVLPRGAAREEIWNTDFYYHHVAQNSAKWFDYACRRRRTRDPGSLYFVTGHHKTSAYGLATVSDTSDSGSLKFSAVAPAVQGTAAFTYSWERCGTAIPRSGPAQPGHNKNQCVFVRGFTITKQQGIFSTRFRGKTKIADITGAKIQDPADPYSEEGPHASDNSSGSGMSEDPPAQNEDASNPNLEDNGLVVGILSVMPQGYDPADIINRYILSEMPEAQFAITHDHQLCDVLDAVDESSPDKLFRMLHQRYDLVLKSGCVRLVTKEDECLTTSFYSGLSISSHRQSSMTALTDDRDFDLNSMPCYPQLSYPQLQSRNLAQKIDDCPVLDITEFIHNDVANFLFSMSSAYADKKILCRDLTNQVIRTDQHSFARGGFADVLMGEWKNPSSADVQVVVIKGLRGMHTDPEMMQTNWRRLHHEAGIWQTLSHQNILPFLGICADDNVWPLPAMISPFCKHGHVLKYLTAHPDADRLKIVIDLANGLQYLHSHEIIHGDLKGNNVLIDDAGAPRLCDFGRSEIIGHRGYPTAFAGTARYMAPELLDPSTGSTHKSEDHDDFSMTDEEYFGPELTKETDVYAFGLLSLEIITDRAPYYYVIDNFVQHVIQGKRPSREKYASPALTDALWMLFDDCWLQQASSRPNMEVVVERLHSVLNPPSRPIFSGPSPRTVNFNSHSGSYRLPRASSLQPSRYTVNELIADQSLLDITHYVRRDPQYLYPIGCGAGGNAYRGIYSWADSADGKLRHINVVIKVLSATSGERQRVQQRLTREIATWSHLNHPNIQELLGIAYLDSELLPGLVCRWVQRHDFLAYIGRHPELKRQKAQEIACGLQYLHTSGVVHGDLKVDNILISDHGVAQITDFGIARIMDVSGYTTMTLRNIRYTAPELRPIIADEDAGDVRSTTASDIFSLGILLLQLFHGPDENLQRGRPYNHVPYRPATGDYHLLVRIHRGERPIRSRYNWINDSHWILMEHCWAGNPLERPDIMAVVQAL